MRPEDRDTAKTFAAAFAKICEQPDIEPRFPFLTGFALVKSGVPMKEAATWFGRAVDGARALRDTPNPTTARTAARIAGEVARAAAATGDDELLARACAAYVELRCNAFWHDKRSSTPTALEEDRNPVALLARRLAERKKFRDLFDLLAGPAGPFLPLARVKFHAELRARAKPADFIAAVRRDLTPAQSLALAQFVGDHFADPDAAAALLDETRRAHPADPSIRFALARLRAAKQDFAGALEATAGEGDRSEPLVLYAARLNALNGRAEAGRALLARHQAIATRPAHWAEAFELCGDRAAALPLYLKAAETGQSANFRIATLLFLDGRFEEALRYYNRERREGSCVRSWPADEQLHVDLPASDAPTSAVEGRLRVLEKLGADFFIARVPARAASATAADERRVADLVAALGGDGREKARSELAALDPSLAPLLKPHLSAKDEWVQFVVREVLNEWAEPR